MQVQMEVFAKSSHSLRRRITTHLDRGREELLFLERSKTLDRSPGWAKVKARGIAGALNLEWDSSLRMLKVRAIAKRGNRPHQLLAIFLDYLVDVHGRHISAINIQFN